MRALLCPASLKGVLSARVRGRGAGGGLRGGGEAVELPVADGGEGTADVLHAALGGEWREALVSDPLGRPLPRAGSAAGRPRGRRGGVCDRAAAAPPNERDPLVASSRGLGELVLAALASRLGAPRRARRHRDRGRRRRAAGGSARAPGADDGPLRRADALADAARLFGPQKGASPEDVAILERAAGRYRGARPYAGLPAPARPAASARRSPRSVRRSCRVRRPFSTSSASTLASARATSWSPARARSTARRRRKGAGSRGRAVRRGGSPLRRLRRSRLEPVAGAETVASQATRACGGRPRELGRSLAG